MQKLYVLYDPKCELCRRLKDWILVQRSWIGLAVLEAGSDKARRLFPELERIAGKDDLAVISDEGAVYLNDRAWIMVLYAMVEYRDWAARLTHPILMPLARQAFAALSKNRHYLSSWLSQEDPEEIAGELRKVELEACAVPAGGAPASAASTVREYLQ
jgi:predicted DCC family thiol-disulfide oxidoreductase YuxK